MLRIFSFLVVVLLFLSVSSVSSAQSQSETEVIENEFTHLVAVSDVVYQLRKKYGISGSVLLTKTLTKILKSYSNQQQAQSIWQTAIKDVVEMKSSLNISATNSPYHAGQVLSQYTHGMNQIKWHKSRASLQISRKSLTDLFATYDDLTLYFYLNDIWQILLSDIAIQDQIQWHEVFANSLQLFSQEDAKAQLDSGNEGFNFFKKLSIWQKSSEKETELADLIQFMDLHTQFHQQYHQEIIRYLLEKSAQHYLSASMTWLGVAQQLFLHKMDLSAKELTEVVKFIEENDTWFLSKEAELLAINTGLPAWLEVSFHHLKAFYREAKNYQDIELASIYQLLEPQLKKYMATPFRQKIRTDLEVCLNISEEFSPLPQEPIDKNQFEGCIKDITTAAVSESLSRELAGSLTKVGSQQALDRALKLPTWQTINLMYANMAKNNCLNNAKQIPNPLEWSLAAESLLWFVDRWPAYLKAYPQNAQIMKIIQQGEKITQGFACLDKTKLATLNTYFKQIVQAWQNVKDQINQVITEFNHNNLAQQSDLNLIEALDKPSNYRVAEMKIKACDVQTSCGVHVELESTRALFTLFPNHLLVADQLKLGSLKLCYDDIGWENRHATSTHLDNDSVANYLGHFSFSLKGYYNDELVFARKLVDKQEYLYLFAANTPEVLDTTCPLDIVGEKISTKLARGTYGLVPNRLTFLTASRMNETSVLVGNWTTGAEWNNKLTSDSVQLLVDNKFAELSGSIQQAYQQKAVQLQASIYKSMLGKQTQATQKQQQLALSFKDMQRYIQLFAATNYILQMNNLISNDDLHGLIYGNNKIPDSHFINELYKNQLNINLLIENIDNNLQSNQEKWNALDKSWSNTHINDILYRLKSLL